MLELIHEKRLKEFLTTATQDRSLAISVLSAQGHSIMDKVSEGIPTQQAQEVISGPAFRGLVTQLLSTPVLDQIQRSPKLPIYGAPLAYNRALLGVVMVWFAHEKDPAISHRDFRLIWLHLQDLLSDGYELDNLSSEIVRNYEELALLYDLSMRLSAQPDLNRICQIVAEQVQSILPNSKVAIMLVNEDKKEIASRLAVDGEGHPLPPFRAELNKGVVGQVIATAQPVIVCNVREHPDLVEAAYPITSLLSVPLTLRDKVLGAINVGDKAHEAEFTTYDLKLVSAIAAGAAVALENARLFGEVADLYLSAVKSLVMAIDAKDTYTHSHSLRVSQISTAVAEVLGLDSHHVEQIKMAALLHDVGKIGVPEHLLRKSGPLTHEEWKEIKRHPLHSVQILKQIKSFEHLTKWVGHEHERYDGKGYPDGLKGEEIPLPSRIIAVADAFDAIISDRYYRKSRSEEVALKDIQAHAGTQFDPKVVEAFLIAFQKGKLKADLSQ